jgi:hypothetical protein
VNPQVSPHKRLAVAVLGLAAAGLLISAAVFPYRSNDSTRPFVVAFPATFILAAWGLAFLASGGHKRWVYAVVSGLTVYVGTLSVVFWIALRR